MNLRSILFWALILLFQVAVLRLMQTEGRMLAEGPGAELAPVNAAAGTTDPAVELYLRTVLEHRDRVAYYTTSEGQYVFLFGAMIFGAALSWLGFLCAPLYCCLSKCD